eukprot:2908962-Pleurochrysis_carterae.AAC.1
MTLAGVEGGADTWARSRRRQKGQRQAIPKLKRRAAVRRRPKVRRSVCAAPRRRLRPRRHPPRPLRASQRGQSARERK